MKNLQEYNRKGLIPGPKEAEKSFQSRVDALYHFFSYPPTDIDRFLTDTDWINVQTNLSHLYDISPDWIVAHYSNRNLTFFQGAATWIIEKDGLRIPLVQLKEKFEMGKLLNFYHREEILAHEAVHAARMQFDEPYFEEIFAYKTSPKIWRRFFGPLFQRPWEAIVFLLFLFLPIAYEVAQFFPLDLESFSWLRLLPLFFFAALFLRLSFLQTTLFFASRRMKKMLQNPEKKWAVFFRMTDREIFQFAFSKNLAKKIKMQKSLRWDLLKSTYFIVL